MSARTSIVQALATEFGKISVANGYKSNVVQAKPYIKFWDEISDYPAIFLGVGSESREYHPGGFKWGFLGISVKLYVKGEYASDKLELLLADVEKVIDASRSLAYDTAPGAQITEIRISNIVTDEGLLEPYGVGEVNIIVQYPVL
jgi:hypothetical protein